MGHGTGWVQAAIRLREDAGARWPSTYTIVADVFRIERDADGNRLCSDTQHGAVKRALTSLQRKGQIIGFRDVSSANDYCYIWMTRGRASRGGLHDSKQKRTQRVQKSRPMPLMSPPAPWSSSSAPRRWG